MGRGGKRVWIPSMPSSHWGKREDAAPATQNILSSIYE